MRSLLPLITLLVACGTEPTPTFEPLSDPPELATPSLDSDSSTVSSIAPRIKADATTSPAVAIEPMETIEIVSEDTLEAPAGLFSTLPDDPVSDVTVQDGESLALIASWTGVTSEEIASLNDIDVSDALYPGQQLVLPVSAADAVALERAAFAEVRLSRFLDRRGGLAGTRTYRVQTGDTAWSIAREELGVPTWVLSHYNDTVSMDRLSIGQELNAPVLGDEAAASLDETIEEE